MQDRLPCGDEVALLICFAHYALDDAVTIELNLGRFNEF